MHNTELLIFLTGSLSGLCLALWGFTIWHGRKMQEANDEFTSLRESIRRNAYSKGYEDAKNGGLKR